MPDLAYHKLGSKLQAKYLKPSVKRRHVSVSGCYIANCHFLCCHRQPVTSKLANNINQDMLTTLTKLNANEIVNGLHSYNTFPIFRLLKVLTNKPTFTHSHTNASQLHYKVPTCWHTFTDRLNNLSNSHQGYVGIQCLAQGYSDMKTGGPLTLCLIDNLLFLLSYIHFFRAEETLHLSPIHN